MSTITQKTPATPSVLLGGHRGGNILEFYPAEFKPEPSPVEIFRQHVVQWFFASKHLRYWENRELTQDPEERDLATHRMVCASLITFGEFAANFAKNMGINFATVGIAVEAIEAETKMLRYNFRMFHDDTMSCDEAENILKEAFHEAG